MTANNQPRGGQRAKSAPTTNGTDGPLEEGWRDHAACSGHHDIFLPTREDETYGQIVKRHKAARVICARCPVFDDCLAWVKQNPQPVGIYAGTSARKRGSHTTGVAA